MNKVLLLSAVILIFGLPVFSAEGEDIRLPNIFIYTIPDNIKQKPEVPEDTDAPEDAYVNETPVSDKSDKVSEDEINLSLDGDDYNDEDDFTLNATTLKGYAEYMEDANTIHLKDDNNNFVLNLKVPQKISASKGMDLQDAINSKRMARYSDAEYNIAPNSVRTASKKGDFTFGALYGNEVDSIAMLESETGLFTKYEKSRFALSTTYKKNLNTTYNQFYDTISLAPEFKLNNYMSIKNEYKADLTRNRKSGALIFSFNPFGQKDSDRMRLELGAKQTIYEDNVTTKTEFSFSTQFKL
ncbi:TPA: hypothetical protein CPT81_07250 [Candidatus Gastranaerophilales bacterium HUM_20]|nr:unknown [Clostridium sp. CAG:729]DAB20180.1 MAG TPA: hypothetical protein CPT81_07250 [Candidatus Gastranaerophilales bacterium HUM_20]